MAEKNKPDLAYLESKAAQIAASFSYDGYKVVRRELFAHTRIAAMTIRTDSITFNTACINGLEDVVYIELMINEDQKRLAIRRSDENSKDSLRWCIAKPDKRKSRRIVGDEFSDKIYKMMGWDKSCRYKVIGYRIPFEGELIYVFELSEPEIYHELKKRTPEEEEELAKSMSPEEIKNLEKEERAAARKPFYPDDVEGTFGVPVKEHESKVVFADPGDYVGMNDFVESGMGSWNSVNKCSKNVENKGFLCCTITLFFRILSASLISAVGRYLLIQMSIIQSLQK